MKSTLVALSLLFVSGIASAEVKPVGTFVPELCSAKDDAPATQQLAVSQVCLGKVVGVTEDAIELTLNDGTTREYAIDMQRGTGRMGVNIAPFSGNLLKLRMHDPIKGALRTTSGITVTYDIKLETKTTQLTFTGPLRRVFVTQ